VPVRGKPTPSTPDLCASAPDAFVLLPGLGAARVRAYNAVGIPRSQGPKAMKLQRLERPLALGIVIAGAIAIYRIWIYLLPHEGQLPDSVIGVRKALALGICGAIALGVCVNAGLVVLFMNWLRSRRARRQKFVPLTPAPLPPKADEGSRGAAPERGGKRCC
jgi:hypothetical protein